MVVIMKNTALLGVLALFAASQSTQCGDVMPNLRVFTKNGLNLFLYSPKTNQNIATQKKAIIDYASQFENGKAIIVVNDNTFLTPGFLKVFPKNLYQDLYEELTQKNDEKAKTQFTSLHELTKDIVQKLNIAFDYFFDCPSCTLEQVIEVFNGVLHGLQSQKISNHVSTALNENFKNNEASLKVSELSVEQVDALNKIKKILLNNRYAQAITQGEHLKKHMFVCVNSDEVDDLIKNVLTPLQWQKLSYEQLRAMIPKPKPSFFSWQTMTAIGVGAVSFGVLGLVAYKNGFFGKVGNFARAMGAIMFPRLYRFA